MRRTSRLGTALAVFAFLVAALALPGVAAAKDGGNGHKEVGANYNHGKPRAFAKKLLPKLEKGQAPQGPAKVGDVRIWPANDDINGVYLKEYTLRGVGEHVEVWVANDLMFPEGDCRNDPFLSSDGNTYSRVTITDAQVDYFIDQFETNIYPKESATFSVPPQRDGHKAQLPTLIPNLPSSEYKGEGDNIVVLIDNVRDDNYYDTDNANSKSFIAGFFWSYFNDLTNRNVMTVDAWDWVHRTTGDPPNDPSTDPCLNSVAKPYDYEGTFAHEYQHLLEEYEDPDEVNWINEGISDWAQTLTGYVDTEPTIDEPDYDSHIQCFLGWLEHESPYNPIPKLNAGPENSLTWWEDQGDDEILCDYGAAYSFMEMLAGRYGTGFMTALHREDATGFEGLQNVLDQFNTGKTALEVLHEWAAMVALDHFLDLPGGTFTGGSIGDYTTPTLDAQVDWANDDAYSTPGAPPNGSDYVRLRDGSGDWFSAAELTSISFNGASSHAPDAIEWTIDNGSLYSGSTDLMDRAIVREVPVPTTNATLSFRTKYDLEQYWDFGFVQVSTDSGETFQSLTTCAGTTDVHDPGAHPTVQANVPGYTGLTDWVTRTCDLSAYAGQTIYLAFRAVTDWNTLGNDATHANDGWWIDDVTLGGTVLSSGDTLAGWQSLTQVNPIDIQFTVQVVSYTSDGSVVQIAQLPLDADQDGTLSGATLEGAIADGADVVGVIVTYDEPTETVLRYAPYTLIANGVTQPGG